LIKTVCIDPQIRYDVRVPKLWNKTIKEHREAVKDAVVDAVAAVVDEDGLVAVTMAGVAERSGIGRATLYKYFADVEALLLAWHERVVHQHLDAIIAIRTGDGPAAEKLEAVLFSFAERARGHPDHLAAALHRSHHVHHARAHLTAVVADLIGEGVAEGAVRADVAADELAVFVVHALAAAPALPSKAAVKRLVEVTLSALRPAPEDRKA
jgi:AcrR family transcriptional regulator